MNSLFKTVILILASSSFSFATAGGPDHLNGKFLEESGNCPQATYSNYNQQKQKNSHKRFTKQMLKGKVLQTQKYGSKLTVKFLPPSIQSFDGDNEPLTPREMIDQLIMEIYGRLDVRIESRREYLNNINRFLHTASFLLIKKHKIDIQLQEIRQHQMAAVGPPPKLEGLMNELGSIESLDGETIFYGEVVTLTTMDELKRTYTKVSKVPMQWQRDNYIIEKDREAELEKLVELLECYGSEEEKNDTKEAEIKRMKYDYKYYKKLLDSPSIWCLSDQNASQEKPLFYPKSFVIEGLYQQYKTELSRSQNPYDAKEVPGRAKKLEEKSQKLKHQFDRDYLYNLRIKPDRLKNK